MVVAIDYSLLMIFRYREELANGEDTETALIETMRHAGRSVIVSGSTVAIGLLSMVILPIPVIRSIGIGGMLIPAVSVIASITLLPALLATVGTRINRLRVMPKRWVERQDPTRGFWHRWAVFVMRRPVPVALAGIAIVAALLVPGLQLNPAEAQLKDYPGSGDAINGRAALAQAGISPEDRDFVHAVYGKFPYVLAFVIILTFVLLMRAFRSIVLPLKAVVLNLVSLGAAYGIIVFIFQWGHGSDAIWGVPATNAIISWIPLMIFAFLYGLSMDYEVFMLTRMREEYDVSGNTATAVELGLARTGKL